MKKFVYGLMIGAAVMLMVMYCSPGDRKASTWKPRKEEGITWQKLNTFMFDDPVFKVEYPDFFVPDSSQLDKRNMRFDYSIRQQLRKKG